MNGIGNVHAAARVAGLVAVAGVVATGVAIAASRANSTPDATDPVHDGDGPGVRRPLASRTELLRDHPELRDDLASIDATTAPPGTTARVDDHDGMRVLTINVHQGVPAGVDMTGPNERLDAIRDVARYVREVDPDVVLVQELVDHPRGTWGTDLEQQPAILGALVDASDAVFTPAFDEPWLQGSTGTAIYARNGWTIDRAINARLPDGERTQPRGAAIARLVPPGGAGDPVTVVGTHLAHGSFNGEARRGELTELGRLVDSIRRTGSVTYEPRMPGWGYSGATLDAAGFPQDRIVLGGDLNATQPAADEVLRDHGMQHAIDVLRGPADTTRRTAARAMDVPTATRNRIDHVYVDGFDVTDGSVGRVPNHALRGTDAPTDHAGVVVDLQPER